MDGLRQPILFSLILGNHLVIKYTFKHVSEALLRILQTKYVGYHNATDNKYDDIAMKTKLVVRAGIIAIRFDEQSFISTIIGFTPHWDYKHYDKYISQKIVNLSTTMEIHLKCDCIDGSVVDGLRQPILYNFVLDKFPGYKKFCQPETTYYKKKKSVLNIITFFRR